MQKLENFIDQNINQFSQLENSEVEIHDITEFDNDVVEYLKLNYRFDYNNICVYYVEEDEFFEEGIWVEYMSDEYDESDDVVECMSNNTTTFSVKI
jgi:hypothetical protein